MILLRYGFRLLLHYSVPMTLGLLAYSGLRIETNTNIVQEKAETKATLVAESTTTDPAKRVASASPVEIQGSSKVESTDDLTSKVAMNDAPAENRQEGTTISRTGPQTGEPLPDEPQPSLPAEAEKSVSVDPKNAPKDSSIDSTAHEKRDFEEPGKEDVTKDSNRAAPSDESVPKADPSSAQRIVLEATPKNDKIVSESNGDSLQERNEAQEVAIGTAVAAAAVARDKGGSAESIPQPVEKSVVSNDSESKEGESPVTQDGVPADLKPEVRAIVAEAPLARPAKTSEAASAEALASAIRSVRSPQVVSDELERKSVENVKADRENAGPEYIPKHDDAIVAKEGETWKQLSSRIYGNERMAETLWRENRDAHGGTVDGPLVAGRMVRMPASAFSRTPNGTGTDLASKSR